MSLENLRALAWREHAVSMIDVESTGLNPKADRVVELAVVVGCVHDAPTEFARASWLLNPRMPIPPVASAIHGITDAMVEGEPAFGDVIDELVAVVGRALPAAFNAGFDRGFVEAEFERAGRTPPWWLRPEVEWIDPLVWARKLQRYERSKKLADVARRCGVEIEGAHRATADAEAALRVLAAFATGPSASELPMRWGQLVDLQQSSRSTQARDYEAWRERKGLPPIDATPPTGLSPTARASIAEVKASVRRELRGYGPTTETR